MSLRSLDVLRDVLHWDWIRESFLDQILRVVLWHLSLGNLDCPHFPVASWFDYSWEDYLFQVGFQLECQVNTVLQENCWDDGCA